MFQHMNSNTSVKIITIELDTGLDVPQNRRDSRKNLFNLIKKILSELEDIIFLFKQVFILNVLSDPGADFDTAGLTFEVEDAAWRFQEKAYLMLHKPGAYECSRQPQHHASVFSLLLGYSRVPYAAARDGNYFRFLAAVHPRHGIPHRSLVALGVVATCFCFFTLTQVITMLVVTRILLQFFLQQFGLMWLRYKRPDIERPFKVPLYPLPPIVAICGFLYIVVMRSDSLVGLVSAAAIGVSGTGIYLIRARRLGEWPFHSGPHQARNS